MKEITRIITAEITMTETMPDNDAEAVVSCKEEAETNVKKTLQQLYGGDDIHVKIQDFVKDKAVTE